MGHSRLGKGVGKTYELLRRLQTHLIGCTDVGFGLEEGAAVLLGVVGVFAEAGRGVCMSALHFMGTVGELGCEAWGVDVHFFFDFIHLGFFCCGLRLRRGCFLSRRVDEEGRPRVGESSKQHHYPAANVTFSRFTLK